MKWPTQSIGELSRVVTKGTTPTTLGRPFVNSGITFVKAEALNGDSSLEAGGFAFIDDETHEILKRSQLQENDVLVTIAGANVGKCGYVKSHHLPANTNQAVGIVRVDSERANPRFIYYFFKLPATSSLCQTVGAQAAQPNVNLTILKSFTVPTPDKETQDNIASILSAYDDLIENNLRRMGLLEEAARQLYREWFVRLRFPGHERVKITNGLPEGWERKTLTSVVEVQSGFAFKSSTYLESGTYRIVTIKNVHDGDFIPEVDSFIENVPEAMPPHCHLTTGDILLSLTGNIGRTCFVVGDKYLLNQRVAKLVPQQNSSRAFTYFTFREESVQKQVVIAVRS
jgi:type I restriction enzyme, S subunit